MDRSEAGGRWSRLLKFGYSERCGPRDHDMTPDSEEHHCSVGVRSESVRCPIPKPRISEFDPPLGSASLSLNWCQSSLSKQTHPLAIANGLSNPITHNHPLVICSKLSSRLQPFLSLFSYFRLTRDFCSRFKRPSAYGIRVIESKSETNSSSLSS